MTTALKYKLDLKAPHTVYRNAEGRRLPGVTTILGVLDKPPLLEWAAREERDYIRKRLMLVSPAFNFDLATANSAMNEIMRDLSAEPYAYTVKRESAANVGTVAHARIHAYLRDTELDPQGLPTETVEKSLPGYHRWLDWWQAEQMKCVATELAMVSEAMQVGGTLDIVADSEHGLTLADVKTTKRPDPRYWPYHEMVGQVAAYRAIWDELHPERHIARACICRVGKETDDPGDVTWLNVGQMAAGDALFRAALAAYRAKQTITRA